MNINVISPKLQLETSLRNFTYIWKSSFVSKTVVRSYDTAQKTPVIVNYLPLISPGIKSKTNQFNRFSTMITSHFFP